MIFGIPAHPLVIHLTAVAVPLAAVIAIVWSARATRFTRSWRLTALITSAVSFASMLVARSTGEALLPPMGLSEENMGIVARHALYANLATAAAGVLFVAVALFYAVGVEKFSHRIPAVPVRILMVAAAIAALVTVVLVGHAGAQLAWADFPNN